MPVVIKGISIYKAYIYINAVNHATQSPLRSPITHVPAPCRQQTYLLTVSNRKSWNSLGIGKHTDCIAIALQEGALSQDVIAAILQAEIVRIVEGRKAYPDRCQVIERKYLNHTWTTKTFQLDQPLFKMLMAIIGLCDISPIDLMLANLSDCVCSARWSRFAASSAVQVRQTEFEFLCREVARPS